MSKGRLFVLSGASGVGKSTIVKKLMEKRSDILFSVSATTREPREGEVDGVHYNFITEKKFQDMIKNNEFLEYDEHSKAFYGTPLAQLEEKLERGDVVLDVEPAGTKILREKRPQAILIFIEPPSMEELERRLRNRGDTNEEQVAMRMERAKWEMKQAPWYDHVVINDVVEDCVCAIEAIIDNKNLEE